jgi:hypothetical protein
MTTTTTAVVVYGPQLADPEHIALAGFLGGYGGLTRDACALDLRQFLAFCDERHLGLRGPAKRHRGLRTGAGSSGSGNGHSGSPTVHRDRLLPLCRGGRPQRPLSFGSRPSASDHLRIPRHRPGPKRGGSTPRRRRARARRRACSGVTAGAERTAGLRSDRGWHRGPGPRTGSSDPRHRAQGPEDRHHPVGASYRAGGRSGHRRT